MKADEWKHWTLVYSLFCLRKLIPPSHLTMWSIFVAASQAICKRTISVKEIDESHNLFKLFCGSFSRLRGPLKCTPNMHLHLHLRQCLFDFGPVYAFWCFSYERFNGILGSFHINNHDICITLMRKFITGSQVRNFGFLNDECMQFLKFTDRNEESISMLDAIKTSKCERS